MFIIIGALFKNQFEGTRDAFSSVNGESFSVAYAGDTFGVGVIVVGCFISTVALIGMVGALCRIRLLLTMYAFIVGVLMIVEMIILTVIVVKAKKAQDTLASALGFSLSEYIENGSDLHSKAIAVLYGTLRCCGVKGSSDFAFGPNQETPILKWRPDLKHRIEAAEIVNPLPANHPRIRKHMPPIARTIMCCPDVDYEHLTAKSFERHYQCITDVGYNATLPGCFQRIQELIRNYKEISISVGVFLLILEIAVIVFTCMVCCQDNADRYYRQTEE